MLRQVNTIGRFKSLFITPPALRPSGPLAIVLNPGFEADWSEESSHWCLVIPEGGSPYRTEIANIFTPPNWLTWFHHDPGIWDQPEVRDAWAHQDERRARGGDKGILLFTFHRKHDGGFLQQVLVTPGTRLRFSAWAHAWSNHQDGPHPDDPLWSEGAGRAPLGGEKNWYLEGETSDDDWRNVTFKVGIDPTGGINPLVDSVVWGRGIHEYNEYVEPVPPVEVTAQGNTITVFLRSTTLWAFKHNDAYWDDVLLEEVEEPPPPGECRGHPRIQYERIYVLLPPPVKGKWLAALAEIWYERGRFTIGASADDAGIGDLDVRHVIAVNPRWWPDDLEAFYAEHYPGVTYWPVVETTLDNLVADVGKVLDEISGGPPPTDEIALWQCNPLWASEMFGGPGCTLTLCTDGCYLTGLAVALRYYGMDKNATPATVNAAIGPSGFSSTWPCRPRWDAIESKLSLNVSDPSNVDTELAQGKCAMAEVQPSTLEHFVLVTEKTPDGNYLCYDPIDGQQRILESKYQGVESWRLLLQVDEQPPSEKPPWAHMPKISLHVQRPCASSDGVGDLEFVQAVQPASILLVDYFEHARLYKGVSPNTVTFVRAFRNHQGQYWDLPPEQGSRLFLESALDSLKANADWIDVFLGLNEIGIACGQPDGIARHTAFEWWLAEHLYREMGDAIAPCLGAVAVGNPEHDPAGEIELMIPMAEQVIKYNGFLGYHGYHRVHNRMVDPVWPDNALHYALRCLYSWDPVFNRHGLYPRYAFTEGGAFLNALAGWKHSEVFDGDWGLFGQSLFELNDLIETWNEGHGWRAIGVNLFTYKLPGDWNYYNLYGYAQALIDLLGAIPTAGVARARSMDWYYGVEQPHPSVAFVAPDEHSGYHDGLWYV